MTKKTFCFVLLMLVAPCLVGAEDFYDRQAAVDYALDWSIELNDCGNPDGVGCPDVWNPDFQSFKDNDCANFVSQCLHAGGWEQNPENEEEKKEICSAGESELNNLAYWFAIDCDNWLGLLCCDGSRTWINAHLFYKRFDSEYVNAQASSWDQLIIGDIISFDYVNQYNLKSPQFQLMVFS